MTWTLNDWFPDWGSSGGQPSANKNYAGQEQVAYQHLNYLWFSLDRFETEVQSALDDVDYNSDGVVDEADTVSLLEGNDIDSNGDGVVDEADSVDRLKGSDLDSEYAAVEQSLDVDAVSIEYIYVTELADGESLSVSTATILDADGTPTAGGVSIRFYGLGSGTNEGAILTSDGTALVEESVSASYSNTSGGTEDIAVVVDNGVYSSGTGSTENVVTSFRARIT